MSEKKIVETNEVQDRIFLEKELREAELDEEYVAAVWEELNEIYFTDLEAEANSNYMRDVL